MPPFTPGSGDLLFLPAAHIFGRVQHTFGLERGLSTTIVNSIKTVIEDVQESKPAFFFSVPRIYEKIFSTARARIKSCATAPGNGVAKRIRRNDSSTDNVIAPGIF